MAPRKRTFERTHPWIEFRLDLRRLRPRSWLLLGEALSKAEHIAGVPLLPSAQRQLHSLYLTKGIQATTAIEGNTLTEEQVARRLRGDLDLPPSREYLGREVDNIQVACKQIGEAVLDARGGDLSLETVCNYTRLVLQGLPAAAEVKPGQIRQHSVGVGPYLGPPAEDCRFLLARMCEWLGPDFPQVEGSRLATGLLKAILAHLYIAWIHPFADGNGRTARLVEFHLLLAAGAPAAAAHLLSNHYNQTRSEYYRQLQRSHEAEDGVTEFLAYALLGFVDGLRDQIRFIQAQQLGVHWINYVHSAFRQQDTAAGHRRRRLVIDLSAHPEGIEISAVRRLTARLAEAYATKTDKTVRRDLNALEGRGLIEIKDKRVRARTELMLAYFSPTVEPST